MIYLEIIKTFFLLHTSSKQTIIIHNVNTTIMDNVTNIFDSSTKVEISGHQLTNFRDQDKLRDNIANTLGLIIDSDKDFSTFFSILPLVVGFKDCYFSYDINLDKIILKVVVLVEGEANIVWLKIY